MKLRVIDYIGNEGGGVRFTVELMRAFSDRPDIVLDLVSDGAALAAYRQLLTEAGVDCTFKRLPQEPTSTPWRYDIPSSALSNCDVVWIPWVHRHRLPEACAARVVGSFHDAIMFTEPLLHPIFGEQMADERETVQRWLVSGARIVVSSNATAHTVSVVFDAAARCLDVIPISGAHGGLDDAGGTVPSAWTWADKPFILCPANISPHKNHETLLRGVAAWGVYPLVLTGTGTDLSLSRNPIRRFGRWTLEELGAVQPHRSSHLRRFAHSLGFRRGDSLLPLGYISDREYYPLLRKAWALVMPTLGEGGGSFPVEEALWSGIPVICADIPVLREHMERLGATVQWFDPRVPEELAARLRELHETYDSAIADAQHQRQTLHRRTWSDVADEYWDVISSMYHQVSAS